jgi:hypothetical protein
MKAEHRHQLQTNALADHMGRLLKGMKSTDKSTSTIVWVFLLLTLGTVAGWRYWAHASQTENSAEWTELDAATHDPTLETKDLADLAIKHRGSFPGRTADFQVARLQLLNGAEGLTVNRSTQASDALKAALERYRKLATECADSPLLVQEALMGVAKAKEGLIGVKPEKADEDYGTLQQAEDAYRALADKYPDSPLGVAAASRLKELEARGPEIEKFYTDLNSKLTTGKAPSEPKLPDLPELPPPIK